MTAPLCAYRPAATWLAAVFVCAAAGGACGARLPPPLTQPAVVEARDRDVRQFQVDVGRLLESPVLARAHVGAAIVSLTRGETLFQYNQDRLLMPASNMKLVTLAVAAERLGWDFSFETRLHTTEPVAGDVLKGDVLVVGTGDPSLSTDADGADRTFAAWADTLRAAGVRHIEGRLIGLDNAFDPVGLGAGWSWDDLHWYYAAPVGALQVNENAVALTVAPGSQVGAPAVVTLGNAQSGLEVQSHAWTSQAGSRPELRLLRYPGSAILIVSGSVPLDGAPIVRRVSVDNPTMYFLALLERALAARGIGVGGGILDVTEIAWPTFIMQPPLVRHRSPPLAELAVTLMKSSQNLYAETLLRALGAELRTVVTAEEGRAVVRETLRTWDIPDEAVVVADASGLSRYNYLTPRALMTVLRRMHGDERHRNPWLHALPIGGVDGTLGRRFTGSRAHGLVRAKTGTLSNVRALSGYVDAAGGERLAFVLLVNNTTAPAREVDTVIDLVVERLAAFRR